MRTAIPTDDATKLAWALIEPASSHLTQDQRQGLFVALGAGDTLGAITRLLEIITTQQIKLRPRLLQRCVAWMCSYSSHEHQGVLRNLVAGLLTEETPAVYQTLGPPPMTQRLVRPHTAPS